MIREAARILCGAAVLMTTIGAPIEAGAREIGGARLLPLNFQDMPGWAQDDHAAAFAVFLRSCEAILHGAPELRPAGTKGENLLAVCRRAREGTSEPRAFFEQNFIPHEIRPESGSGFLTGYFEPEYAGSMEPVGAFRTPLLARPDSSPSRRGKAFPAFPIISRRRRAPTRATRPIRTARRSRTEP
jgi:membrane-bound lytic murein transglycosylase A